MTEVGISPQNHANLKLEKIIAMVDTRFIPQIALEIYQAMSVVFFKNH